MPSIPRERRRIGNFSVRAAMSSEIDIDLISRALQRPRPGLKAQMRMMPRPRAGLVNDEPTRDGGVLLLLYPADGRLHLVLTRRADHLSNHSGQVSLPGGAQEAGESLEETALREAREELDVEPADVEVLGELTPLYVSVSNYCIHPFVGHVPARPSFRPDPREVAEVLEVPLSDLLDPSVAHEEEWELRERAVQVPFFAMAGHKVWGATAMVLAEFVELVSGELGQ